MSCSWTKFATSITIHLFRESLFLIVRVLYPSFAKVIIGTTTDILPLKMFYSLGNLSILALYVFTKSSPILWAMLYKFIDLNTFYYILLIIRDVATI